LLLYEICHTAIDQSDILCCPAAVETVLQGDSTWHTAKNRGHGSLTSCQYRLAGKHRDPCASCFAHLCQFSRGEDRKDVKCSAQLATCIISLDHDMLQLLRCRLLTAARLLLISLTDKRPGCSTTWRDCGLPLPQQNWTQSQTAAMPCKACPDLRAQYIKTLTLQHHQRP